MVTSSVIMTNVWPSTPPSKPKPTNAANWCSCAVRWTASCLKWAGRRATFRKPSTGRVSLLRIVGWTSGMSPPRRWRTKPIGLPARSSINMPGTGRPRRHQRPSARCATGSKPPTSTGFPSRNSAVSQRRKGMRSVMSRLPKPSPPMAHAWKIHKRRPAAA